MPAALLTPSPTVKVPSASGVPERTPVCASNDAHAGSAPVVSVRGVEPLAVSVYEKAWPTTPSADRPEVMAGRVRTESSSDFVSAPPSFSARSCTVKSPSAVGVPESTPPENVAHAGTPVAPKVMTPVPVAVAV